MADKLELLFIAARVRELRVASGKSQDEFARLVGCHRSLVSQIERAVRNLSVDTIDRLATALGVDPVSLFYDKVIPRELHNSEPLRERVPLNVLALRTGRRLSQDALSERAKLSRNYVSSLEVHRPNADLGHLKKLATVLDVPVSELFAPIVRNGTTSDAVATTTR
ncbi:helix-turn-helix domain-containing protein [Paraburkholderia nodosa]|uniref:helix-turn-helix domain-containing protein n=1 Tax=Paraburkholderia nodosa TaxID=392320 RepID=UPI001376DFC6|nr:helix-turn-helix domain-containing protein [Paraburkholderia nodosa]